MIPLSLKPKRSEILTLEVYCEAPLIIVCNYSHLAGFLLQLSEELQRAKQTHNGEVDGMRKEVSKLTAELHQRDITITTLRGSWVSVRRQLCGEVERGELKVSKHT